MPVPTSADTSSRRARGTLNEGRLRALLDHDRNAGGIPCTRNNQICRSHYARLLGCTPGALRRFRVVFTEYEERFGIATGPMQHFQAMQIRMAEAYADGTLAVRDNKLDRALFLRQFGVRSDINMSRYPQIAQLICDYDEQIARENYLPLVARQELHQLMLVLAGPLPLNKSRKNINQVVVAKKAGLPHVRLREPLFARAIATRQAELLAEVEKSRIDPYVFGKVFQFSDLAAAWGTLFLERLGRRFKQIAEGLAPAGLKHYYRQTYNFLKWIAIANTRCCRDVLTEANAKGRIISSAAWEEAIFAYRDNLVCSIADGKISHASASSAISGMRILLERLTSARIVPAIATQIPQIKHARRHGNRLRTVAEAGTSNGGGTYIEFARNRFIEARKQFGLDMAAGGSELFIESIDLEMQASHDLHHDPATAIRVIIERRLEALHARAVSIVDTAMKSYQQGRDLLSMARFDGAAFEAAYLGNELTPHERRVLVKRLFPCPASASRADVQQGLANLVALIEERHGGIVPRGIAGNEASYGQFFAGRYLDHGGLKFVEPLLHPSADTVGAILTLYLIESGSNIGVARTLDSRCLERSELPGYFRVTGNKARAKGRPIVVDLPETSKAIQAMEWLVSSGRRMRARLASDPDSLFVMRLGWRVQVMTPHWYTNWFKEFVLSIPLLAHVGLVPNMIRPSVLLQAALSNEGRLQVGVAIGQHGIPVSQGYQQKWPTRLLYDEHIKRFQAAFETLIVSGIDDAALKLGISIAAFESRLRNLKATGLGTFCRDRRGRGGTQGGECTTLDCWNACPNLLIVAEVEAIASLQLWQAALRSARPEWERDRPERWDEVWLPWLCLTDVVEEKMVRGTMVKVWRAAQARAAHIVAQDDYVPFRPW